VNTDDFGIAAGSNVERLLKTLRFERTDRVPNWELQIEARTVERFVGKSLRSGALPVPDMVQLALRTGMDAIFSPTPRGAGNLRGLGERWRREEDGSDTYLGGGVKSREELARFDLDALAQRWLVQAESFMDECLEATRGTGLGVAGRVDGPFWLAQLSMGLEESLVAMVEDPDLVVRIMDFYAGYQQEVARAVVRKGLPLALAADDLAHTDGLLVSPAWLERYWFPRMQTILEPLVTAGIPCVFHSCGKLAQVIPFLLRLRCAAVQALQPNCNDIYEVRRRYGKQIALMGNIDITYPLSQGTAEEVRRDVVEHLDRLAPEGGYIVGSSHSVLNSVPPENYIAMVKTTQEWRLI
jgi:uroporphyrinogen decarboxylase